MNSVNYKNKNTSENTYGHKYNLQHIVFVSKYRYKVFKNPKTQQIIKTSLYEVASKYKIEIKEFAFGEDFAHIHMEINVPNTLSIAKVIQILKSYSSRVLFQSMPNYKLRYPRHSFWGGQYSNGSVGPRLEETVINYIRRQDVSVVSA